MLVAVQVTDEGQPVRNPRCVCNGASGRPHARSKTTQGARPRALPPATPASLANGHTSTAHHQITKDPTPSGCLLG